ncbi:MAG: response regulator [Pseudohongiellaceae bacterium]
MSDSLTILVVDDDPVIRPILEEALSKDHRVISAPNGEAAWKVLQQENSSVELIVSDMEMPLLDGLGLLQRVRANFPQIGMIMISGSLDTRSAIEAMRKGAYDYISKPFNDIEELLLIIQRWRYQQSLEAKLMQYAALHRDMMKNMKIRTFLAIDVAGSIKLKRDEDPFLVQFSFSAYQKFISLHVSEYGGLIQSTSGDGTMACFVSAADAFTSACAILANLDLFNRSTNRLDQSFILRMGMHTGPVIVEESGKISDMFSESLDIAGHIQKDAAPGTLEFSDATREDIQDNFDFDATGGVVDGFKVYRFKQ